MPVSVWAELGGWICLPKARGRKDNKCQTLPFSAPPAGIRVQVRCCKAICRLLIKRFEAHLSEQASRTAVSPSKRRGISFYASSMPWGSVVIVIGWAAHLSLTALFSPTADKKCGHSAKKAKAFVALSFYIKALPDCSKWRPRRISNSLPLCASILWSWAILKLCPCTCGLRTHQNNKDLRAGCVDRCTS